MSEESKPRTLRERLKQATEAAILDAAEEVMAEEGAGTANMQVIADRAGTSVGTLYNYFKNRDDLVRALLTSRREELFDRLERAAEAAHGLDTEARLTAVIGAVFEQFKAHHPFLRIAVESEHVRPLLRIGESRPEARPAMRQIEDRARVCVEAGIQAGELRAADAAVYPSALTGIIRAVLLRRLEEDCWTGSDDDVRRIVQLFLKGAGVRR